MLSRKFMRSAPIRRAVVFCAAAVLLLASAGLAQEPKRVPASGTVVAPIPGVVRLPNGTSYTIYLCIKERKGKRFTGTLTYNLGLRQQTFEVDGVIDEKGITFQEKPARLIHPHCPSLGNGKYEIRRNEKIGVAYLLLAGPWTTKEATEIAFGMRKPAKCDFVLGAYHIPEAKGGKKAPN